MSDEDNQQRPVINVGQRPARFARTQAILKTIEKTTGKSETSIIARLLLSEFDPRLTTVFSSKKICPGTEVNFTLSKPMEFNCRAVVIAVHEVPSQSHVISKNKFQFRLVLQMRYETPESEKESILKIKQIQGINEAA